MVGARRPAEAAEQQSSSEKNAREEHLEMANRVIVMQRGKITSEVTG